jgi:hypothetical protein
VKSERDQMSEDLINAENAFTDVKKRNEKLKLIINEHKAVRFRLSKILPFPNIKIFQFYRIPKH